MGENSEPEADTDFESNREEGVDFGSIDPVLEDLDYPVTKATFVDGYGDRTVERTNAGPIAVGDLFDGTGEDTFESPAELRQALLNLMPRDAVGRSGYSDRGGSTPDETPRTDDVDGGADSL